MQGRRNPYSAMTPRLVLRPGQPYPSKYYCKKSQLCFTVTPRAIFWPARLVHFACGYLLLQALPSFSPSDPLNML